MSIRKAHAEWLGDYNTGQGIMFPGSGSTVLAYNHGSVHEGEEGTSPIEILGASVAGCYNGALSAILTKVGYPPARIITNAEVQIDELWTITGIDLYTEAEVPGITEELFLDHAERAKRYCPVAKALSVEIALQAKLKTSLTTTP